jgi:predicted nucleotidyltransferase
LGHELKEIIDWITEWAKKQPDVQGVLLVGSRARGNARPDSDVDLVVISAEREKHLADPIWGPARREPWGALVALRFRHVNGLELDLGFVEPSWARQEPVDPGTTKVLRDGATILYDPRGQLKQLRVAVQ